MRFAVFTHVEHFKDQGLLYAYAPYVREMNLWFRQVRQVEIVAPLIPNKPDYGILPYVANETQLNRINSINFLSIKSSLFAFAAIPLIMLRIYSAMKEADHLHLRCPGNIGLLASIVQVFFPSKPKTVKYAGNWTESSGQPFSYRFQKWILSNEFLSRNIRVLVYGEVQNKSKNISPFFTASFSELEKKVYKKEFLPPYKFLFVGSLVEGKRPMFAVKFVENLHRRGVPCSLDLFGTGSQFIPIKEYIQNRGLNSIISLRGSRELKDLKQAYKDAHFVILASKSEGWPKALAEGMFYGCIPIGTSVSCVPWMLGKGQRGILIKNEFNDTLTHFEKLIKNKALLKKKSLEAQKWAQNYTLEKFEAAISEFV